MGEWRYSSTILDLGTRKKLSGQLHAPVVLHSGERAPAYPLHRSLGGPRAGLDTVEKRKIYCLCRELNPCYQNIRHILEDSNLYMNICKNLKSVIVLNILQEEFHCRVNI
jgi:hypothetical protein